MESVSQEAQDEVSKVARGWREKYAMKATESSLGKLIQKQSQESGQRQETSSLAKIGMNALRRSGTSVTAREWASKVTSAPALLNRTSSMSSTSTLATPSGSFSSAEVSSSQSTVVSDDADDGWPEFIGVRSNLKLDRFKYTPH